MVYKSLKNHVFAFLLSFLEVNYNLGSHKFGRVEAVGGILEPIRIISRNLLNNSYLSQYNLTSEEIRIKINKHNDRNIRMQISTRSI